MAFPARRVDISLWSALYLAGRGVGFKARMARRGAFPPYFANFGSLGSMDFYNDSRKYNYR